MVKKFYPLLMVFTAFLGLNACMKKTTVDYAVVSGQINNLKNSEVKITSINGFSKTITPDLNGEFQDTLYLEGNGFYTLTYDMIRFSPYLENGANFHFSFNGKESNDALNISGKYKELNKYFYQKSLEDKNFKNKMPEFFRLEESVFENTIAMQCSKLEDLFQSIEELPGIVKEKELKSLNYDRLAKKNDYKRAHGYFTNNPDFKVSDDFVKELEDVDYNNSDDYLYSQGYRSIISTNIQTELFNYIQNDSLSYQDASFKAYSNIENEVIRNQELFKFISMDLAMTDQKDEDYNNFLKASTNDEHKAKVKEIYESLKVLDPGQPSPKFYNFENYTGGKTSLDDLKGRYVYVDVWATWCGPCKYEVPFLKELEEKYHDNENIYFLSLSVDKQKDKEKWRNMISERELGGVQLISDNAFDTRFVKDYKIGGIPQFIMIDPQGKIVQAVAPRPSETDKIIKLFNDLGI